MANLRGPGGMKQLNLIASFSESQVMRSEDTNEITGVYLTVQKDQSNMTQKDAKAGKADTNPYLDSHEVQGKDDGTYVSHNVWYSKSQLDAMQSVGQTVVQEDGRTAIAFKADVQKAKDSRTGETRVIVLTPKNPDKAKTAEDKAKVEKYNEAHPMGKSDNTKFNEKSLAKQEKITAIAKANRPERDKAAEAQAQVENQAEAAGPEMG